MAKFKIGSEVEWAWGKGHAEAKVKEVFLERVTKTLKGKQITRNGSPEVPAYLLEQANGSLVLKLESELTKSEKKHGWA